MEVLLNHIQLKYLIRTIDIKILSVEQWSLSGRNLVSIEFINSVNVKVVNIKKRLKFK